MAFEGSLATLSFADLIQLLGSTRKTGTLHVVAGSERRGISLREGRVILTSSSDERQQIGHVLTSLGKVSEEDVRGALARGRRESKLLGQVLVEEGKVSAEVLRRYLGDKAYEMVAELMSWTDAHFRFEEFSLPAATGLSLDLSAEELLMEGFRRSDEVSRFKSMLPGEEVLLERTGDAGEAELMDQTVVGLVLRKLDEPRSVRQLKSEVTASDFTLLDGIAKLIEKGVLRPRPHLPSPPPDPDWLPHSRKLVMAGLYDSAIEVLRAGLAEDPGQEAARALLARAESGFEREVTRKELPLAAIAELVKPLDALGDRVLYPAEAFLLTRINGEVAVGTLVETTPLPAAETLRSLQRLLREGHIRLCAPRPETR